MNLDKLERLLVLSANLGVLIGIIFVGIEISQNNDLLASQDRYNRLEVATQAPRLFLEDADLPRIIWETPYSELTESEAGIARFYYGDIFLGMEWTFMELPEDEVPIVRWRNWAQSVGAEEFVRYWSFSEASLAAEFVEYMQQNVIDKLL